MKSGSNIVYRSHGQNTNGIVAAFDQYFVKVPMNGTYYNIAWSDIVSVDGVVMTTEDLIKTTGLKILDVPNKMFQKHQERIKRAQEAQRKAQAEGV